MGKIVLTNSYFYRLPLHKRCIMHLKNLFKKPNNIYWDKSLYQKELIYKISDEIYHMIQTNINLHDNLMELYCKKKFKNINIELSKDLLKDVDLELLNKGFKFYNTPVKISLNINLRSIDYVLTIKY